MKKQNMIPTIDEFKGEYAFLSNFYPSPHLWKTNEHFFQMFKAELIGDMFEIFNSISPNIAKKRGRKAKLRKDWNEVKDYIMIIGLWIKFSNDDTLKEKLLNTGNANLVEGNYWHDNYWGDCGCDKCLDKEGENKLGKMLMLVREILRKLDYMENWSKED